ncbi:MAG: 3-methyl-2-oxobutanoate hydroxymethyltransferase [Chloroflexota bacterium]
MTRKVSILDIQKRKDDGVPITMVTAYDFTAASLIDQTDIDMILVGDSLGMVMLGYESTVSVTMDEMIHHAKAVARGAKRPFLVGDLPFMSYVDTADALRNAGRHLKEGGMHAVKLEGGREVALTVEVLVQAGIPVMGHIGLTPQRISKLGGFKVQGQTAADAERLLEDALALQEAGCFSIVLEAVPAKIAEKISYALSIPTVGIGAGAGCDGQVLVYQDMLGMSEKYLPRFVKRYAEIGDITINAMQQYVNDVQNRTFPADEHTYKIKRVELDAFLEKFGIFVEE